jgi:hypothetical protein
MDLPIICTLNESELRERRRDVLECVRAKAVETISLPDGYAYKFASGPEILATLARLVALEYQCCRFLTFKILVEAGDGPITLEVTGPPEAKAMIADFLGGVTDDKKGF